MDGKIFATMTFDEAMVKVPIDDVGDYLEEDEIFFAYGKWTFNHGSIGVRLKKISVARMRQLLKASYEKTKTRARSPGSGKRARARRSR